MNAQKSNAKGKDVDKMEGKVQKAALAMKQAGTWVTIAISPSPTHRRQLQISLSYLISTTYLTSLPHLPTTNPCRPRVPGRDRQAARDPHRLGQGHVCRQ